MAVLLFSGETSIGYSFRDKSIDSIIREVLRENKTLSLINICGADYLDSEPPIVESFPKERTVTIPLNFAKDGTEYMRALRYELTKS